MTRLMHDGIDTRAIPPDARMVAGYVNGKWPSMIGYPDDAGAWVPSIPSAFPRATHVSIAVSADADAQVLDCETYDATPAECPAWARRQRARAAIPTVYMNAATWPAVRQAFADQNTEPPNYWVAAYDEVAALPAGAVAKQYRNTPGYDLSVVADYWPGVDPAPVTPPSRKRRDVIVLVLTVESGGKDAYWIVGGKMIPAPNQAARQSHIAAGGLTEHWPVSECARVSGVLNG